MGLEKTLKNVIICGNLVTTNDNLVQNVVQTCQFVLTIEYNQPTQNNVLQRHYFYFLMFGCLILVDLHSNCVSVIWVDDIF